ncbi:MAG: twin-arginine translocation pathway signal protein [Candidatus Neomarinimicrobiota bacterium]
MERRTFVKVLGIGGVYLTIPELFTGCATSSKLAIARSPWEIDGKVSQYDDIRLKILSYAILAPNPHNKQPWIIDLRKPDEISLYIDPERLLPMTDPFHRQIYIGQGTFLELLVMASKEFGYNPKIQLFPNGIDSVRETGKSPIATAKLQQTEVEKDELFSQIPHRITNRRPYNDMSLLTGELTSLGQSYDSENYPIRFVTDDEKLNAMGNLMTKAMEIETYLERTHAETVSMIRFNDEEVAKHRDGFSYENMGVTGTSRFFAEMFAGRKQAFGDSFREKTVSVTREMTQTAKAFGLMFARENNRIVQVEIGRQYARVHLTATKLGLAMHPMSQVLQEYDELAEVRQEFFKVIQPIEGIPQMLFRLGRSKSTPHSPRRELLDLVRS